jgi:hypothetical protein
MPKSSERHLIENEILLRQINRNGARAVKKAMAPQKNATKIPLEFHCECSDLDCKVRISLSIDEYEKIHQQKDRFIIGKYHDIPTIEKVVEDKGKYLIVEKFALEHQPK